MCAVKTVAGLVKLREKSGQELETLIEIAKGLVILFGTVA